MKSLPIGQLFVFGFKGQTLPAEAYELLTAKQASGVVLFRPNIDSLEQLVELNRAISLAGGQENPALIAVDQEGGRVARLKNICTPVPSMKEIGEKSLIDEKLPFQLGAMMAREMVALGFHLDFAPVVDVNTNPNNPIIGDRSFSSEPELVCKMATAFISGMQQSGLAACAKHFPGHGDTDLDSHHALPTLLHNWQRLSQVELPPFQTAAKANVAAIMTGHLLVPELDLNFPVTLSRAILQNVLRNHLGYKGVIVSDDLTMKAITNTYSLKEAIYFGVMAGIDLFLICHGLSNVYEAIEITTKLAEENSDFKNKIEESLLRIRNLKQKYIGTPHPPTDTEARKIVRCSPHLTLAEKWTR